MMVQGIGNFSEGWQKGLAIRIRCDPCSRTVLHAASEFRNHIRQGEYIEVLRWRCSRCGRLASDVRWTGPRDFDREALAEWRPPSGYRRLQR